MHELILLLAETDKEALGVIRCLPELQIATHEKFIYLRGIHENAGKEIKQLPVLHSYWLDAQAYLFPVNGLTPVGKLPQLNWIPITEFIPVEMPVAAMPGKLPAKEMIRLIATEDVQESFAIKTHLPIWKAWADTAPAIRLAPLQFAVSANNEVLITGFPLPAVPGKSYWMQHHLLMPAGYTFEAAVIPEIIAAELNADKDSLLLFDTDASWQAIPLNAFVPASRSAVRLTDFVK